MSLALSIYIFVFSSVGGEQKCLNLLHWIVWISRWKVNTGLSRSEFLLRVAYHHCHCHHHHQKEEEESAGEPQICQSQGCRPEGSWTLCDINRRNIPPRDKWSSCWGAICWPLTQRCPQAHHTWLSGLFMTWPVVCGVKLLMDDSGAPGP